MRISVVVDNVNIGINAYRLVNPLTVMAKEFEDEVTKIVAGERYDTLEFATQLDLSDLIIVSNYLPLFANLFTGPMLRAMQKRPYRLIYGTETHEMVLKPAAPYVIEIDDNMFEVSPYNTAFSLLGRLGPNGEALGLSDCVHGLTPDGELKEVWIPNKAYSNKMGPGSDEIFNVCENRRRLRKLVGALRAARGITTTTHRLARAIERATGRPDAFVFPNTVVKANYPKWQSPWRDQTTILWQGGSSHYEDLYLIMEPLSEVLNRNSDVKLVLFGQEFPPLYKLLPKDRIEYVTWVPNEAYHSTLRTFGHSINLAPLSRSTFNESKSAIKWYESSALEYPAATLASNIPPFSDEMVDGETGLLYSSKAEFAEKLQLLIDDIELRKRLAKRAHEWVWANRDIKLWVPKLREYYLSLIEKQRQETEKRYAFVAEH